MTANFSFISSRNSRQKRLVNFFNSDKVYCSFLKQTSKGIFFGLASENPLSVNVETFGTGKIADDKIAALVEKHFDLRPGATR